MPDMTIEHFRGCETVTRSWSVKIPSKKDPNVSYLVTRDPRPWDPDLQWTCECRGFKFRSKCSHIQKAKEAWCGWHEFIDGGYKHVRDKGRCPRCKGETEVQKWAV